MPKRRRRINWGPVLWLLFLLNTTVGVLYSRATAVRKVVVNGAADFDRTRITEQLQILKGVPCAKINRNLMEEKIGFPGDVRRVELTRNVFGRAMLKIEYQQPVAAVAGTAFRALSEDGVLYRSRSDVSLLPQLSLDDSDISPGAAFGSPWRAKSVASVCRTILDTARLKDCSVEVQKSGAVCLNSGSLGRIELGEPIELDRKFSKLLEVLEDDSLVLSKDTVLNLVSSRPALSHRPSR